MVALPALGGSMRWIEQRSGRTPALRGQQKFVIVLGVSGLAALCAWPVRVPTAVPDRQSPGADIALPHATTARQPRQIGAARVGTVLDPRGAPIAGATVCACVEASRRCDEPTSCEQTDAAGSFSFASLVPGSYVVYAYGRGHQPACALGGQPIAWPTDARGALTMTLADATEEVSGFVVDAFGGQVAGARVRGWWPVGPADTKVVPIEASSDERGEFALSLPPQRTAFAAHAQGYAPAFLTRTPSARGVRFVLVPAARLSGRVVAAESGTPLSDIHVTARSQATVVHPATAVTDAQGQFVLDEIPLGSYELQALGSQRRGTLAPIVIDAAVDVADVRIAAERAARVTGRVVGPADAVTCVGGTIGLLPLTPAGSVGGVAEPATIDATGGVEWPAVRPGRYQPLLRCADHGVGDLPPLEVGIADVTDLLLRIERGSTLHVSVVDTLGRAASDVRVELKRAIRRPISQLALERTFVRRGLSDRGGQVSFSGLPAGAYELRTASRREPLLVELSGSDSESHVRLQLAAAGSIAVTLSASDEAALDALKVYAVGDSGASFGLDTRVSNARAELGPLPVGRYRVYARDGINARVAARGDGGGESIEVRADEVAHAELRLPERRAAVSGRVIDAMSQPLAGVWIRAVPSDRSLDPLPSSVVEFEARVERRNALSAADGSFEIAGLSATDQYAIIAERPDGGQSQLANVRAGDRVELRMASDVTNNERN